MSRDNLDANSVSNCRRIERGFPLPMKPSPPVQTGSSARHAYPFVKKRRFRSETRRALIGGGFTALLLLITVFIVASRQTATPNAEGVVSGDTLAASLDEYAARLAQPEQKADSTPAPGKKPTHPVLELVRDFYARQGLAEKRHLLYPSSLLDTILHEGQIHPELRDISPVEIGPSVQIAADGTVTTTMRLPGRPAQIVTAVPFPDDPERPFRLSAEALVGWSSHYLADIVEKRPTDPVQLRAFLGVSQDSVDAYSEVHALLKDKWMGDAIAARTEADVFQDPQVASAIRSGLMIPMLVEVRFSESDPEPTLTRIVQMGWH